MSRIVKIGMFMDRYPAELSGGQQQRVAIARTLAPQPQVLFMDEPLSNLDAKLRLEMRYELQRLHVETGSTFVYVTHDQMEAIDTTIYGTMPTGMESTLKLKVGEYLLTGVIFGGVIYKIGQEERINIMGENILLFDRKSGKLICSGELRI